MSVSTTDILLPHMFPADVQQMVLMKEEAPEEQRFDVDQQSPEPLHIKKEEEELWIEELNGKGETDTTRFSFTVVPFKSEDDEKPLLSQFHQHQIEYRDLPTSSLANQMTAETVRKDGGGAETPRNLHLKTTEDDPNSSETDVSEDDDEEEDVRNLDSEFKHFSDSENGDWEESTTTELGLNTVTKSLSCSESGKPFINNQSFHRHVTSHSRMRSSGGVVDKKCSRVKKKIHVNEKVLATPKSFSCDNCGKIFTQKANLNRHMRVHTGEKPFSCDVCGQRFSQKTNLATHKRIHTGQKPFACVVCGHRFSHEANLVTHKRIHTGQKPFPCVVCGQRFTQKTTLDKHIIIHTGEKPFDCDICGQQFSLKANLNMHMRIHTGEKPYGCDVCGQKFTQKTNLITHQRIHTGQKPFVCVVCGQSFSHKTNLVTHKRIHTGEKPFPCVECGQRFTQKTTLNKHMRIHTDDKLNLTYFI